MNSTSTEPAADKRERLREELPQELAQFSGDLVRYRHWTNRLIYTPGVKHLAERAGAYWLIDLVASWQLYRKVAAEEFQVWKLAVRADKTATATATDGNRGKLATQRIEFTDFPLQDISIWLVQGTLMLPGEY
jgi:hypothetical protein